MSGSESSSASRQIFQSVNPATEDVIAEYSSCTIEDLEHRIVQATSAFAEWKSQPMAVRIEFIQKLAEELRKSQDSLARLMTREMGKPIGQARAEIEKCALLCDYYQNEGPSQLAPQMVTGNAAAKSYIRFDPLGAVLAVMPWNFPFWQVFRFAVPSLLAGNVGILKHASNVLGCASAIEELFERVGFPPGVFTSLNLDRDRIPDLIRHQIVRAVTLTGSEVAGRAVAEAAGRELKKCVLELGGSDPFIVFPDADLSYTVKKAVQSRIMNNGQSCIAAKRFIIHRDVYSEFVEAMTEQFKDLQVGDPENEKTQLGPLARRDLRDHLHQQVCATIKEGARLTTGGKVIDRPGWFYEPTLLSHVGPEMTAFQEETFGPVAALTRIDHMDEAVELANQSSFGLGASLWTQDQQRAEAMAEQIESGNVFINEFTKSDPSLPFGGVKMSGFGRELGVFGLHEFVNVKTVWIEESNK